MKKSLSVLGFAFLAVLILSTTTPPASAGKPDTAGSKRVSPNLECVVEHGTSRYTAVFGFKNPNPTAANVAVGPQNYFNPSPQDRGQPTAFPPGVAGGVFATPFGGSKLTWRLDGLAASASQKSPKCLPYSSPLWSSKTSMPDIRIEVGAAAGRNGKIYAVGGEVYPTTQVARVDEYDIATDAWTPRKSLNTIRSGHGVVAANNGKLYAIGGWNAGGWVSSVEEYDPTTDTWTYKASMPVARAWFNVGAASNGKIYAIGGQTPGYQVVATVDEFDPATNTWTSKASLPAPRYWTAVAGANDKLYVFGGTSGYGGAPLNTVYQYDPAIDQWATKASMPTARWDLRAAQLPGGTILALGGHDGAQGIPTVEKYDPITDTWKSHGDMLASRAGFGVAVGSNAKLYVLGGSGPGIESFSIHQAEFFGPR